MILEFNTYELKEDSKNYKMIIKNDSIPNEFIVIGEEMVENTPYYKTHHLDSNGLCLIGGLPIDECAFTIRKEDLRLKTFKDGLGGYEIQEIDIPKEYLTMDIIENIQRLNE